MDLHRYHRITFTNRITLIPFCLLWSVLKVQPVHRRKTLVSDKVKSSFFGKSWLYFEIKVIHSVLFCPFPGCNISCSTDSFPHREAGIIKFIKVAIVERGRNTGRNQQFISTFQPGDGPNLAVDKGLQYVLSDMCRQYHDVPLIMSGRGRYVLSLEVHPLLKPDTLFLLPEKSRQRVVIAKLFQAILL